MSDVASEGMKAAVFINDGAGSAGAVPDNLEQILRDADISAQIFLVGQNELVSAVDSALRQPFDAVIGAGGDGTLSTLASRLADTGIPLGVLPFGTHNHFAKDLGVPLDLLEAINCITERDPHRVDIGEVNGHAFINNSSIGTYPEIVEERENKRARLGIPKWVGNLIALLKILRRWPMLYVKLELNGRSFSRVTPFVFVGNNEYAFNPRKDRFRERLHAGELCVFMIRARSIWSLVRLFWLSLRNRLNEAQDFESHFTRELTIHSHRSRLRVSRDGEICRLPTPLRYRIRPGALLVFSPSGRARQSEPLHDSHRAHIGPALRH